MSKKRTVNVTRGKKGFQTREPKAASPSNPGATGLPTVTSSSPSSFTQPKTEAVPLGSMWSEYVKLGEAKKSPPAPAKKQSSRKPAAASVPANVRPAPPAARRPSAITKQTTSTYYGEANKYHATTRRELTRATMLLSRTARENRPDMVQTLPQTVHRIATLIHQYDPRVHGGEPNVMSDRTRAAAAWIVNNKKKSLIVKDPETGKVYLDSHASRLLLSAETDMKKNEALNAAHRKNLPITQSEPIFSR